MFEFEDGNYLISVSIIDDLFAMPYVKIETRLFCLSHSSIFHQVLECKKIKWDERQYISQDAKNYIDKVIKLQAFC
jgi:hypothetical protein